MLVTPRPYPARPETSGLESHTGLRGQIITMTTKPKRPPAKAPEHERARYWRENIVNLSRRELAERIGISASRITDYERGHDRGSGAPIDQGARTRYRLACAAVALGIEFDWLTLSHLTPLGQVRLTMPGEDSWGRGD